MAKALLGLNPQQTAIVNAGVTAGKMVGFDLTPTDPSLWPCVTLNGVRTHPLDPQQVLIAKDALARGKTLAVVTAAGKPHIGEA